jgi:hypothetical protein
MFQWLAGKMRHTEWKIASIAAVCAIASSIFATNMIQHSDEAPALGGSEHFMIFARPSTTRREPFMKFAPPSDVASQSPDVDPMPIGTIGPKPQGSSSAQPVALPAQKALPGFFVRGAYDGKVLVQGPTGFELVGPGDKLTDAGPVLSIKYEKGHWIVLTETGSISSASSN